MATNVRDPRSIITPDAFELSKELLGTPLARPSRRLWAMLIDLVVIGLLTVATSSITLILWGAVAVFLVSMAFRNPGKNLGQVGSVLFRGATGCLGAVILAGVLIGFFVAQAGDDGAERLADLVTIEGAGPAGGGLDVSALLGGVAGVAALGGAEDADEAVAAVSRIFSAGGAASGMDDEPFDAETARAIFDELVPDDAPWAGERDEVFERALEAAGIEPVVVDRPDLSAEAAGRLEGLSEPDALTLFLELQGASAEAPLEPVDAETFTLLRARLAGTVASDSLEALGEELADARSELEQAEERALAAEADLASGQGGFRGLIRDIWEQAGSAIGLWSLYFTIALTLTGGRTVGKKLMGLRVLRLDGEPLTWWSAFERAGGYVAGIATGTLGFVQVFWDANRQCVHDKIVGTVVVIDGAEIEPGAWQEAWAAQRNVE